MKTASHLKLSIGRALAIQAAESPVGSGQIRLSATELLTSPDA